MATSEIRDLMDETAPSTKLAWEPMRLVAVGTVASLLESTNAGSFSDGATQGPKRRAFL